MLIAEIGVNHFGDVKAAEDLITAAHESGADLIKSQAYRAKDLKSGSMPLEFYFKCEMEMKDYLHLIQFARELGNDLFYSIFSEEFRRLESFQNWHKVAGIQTATMSYDAHKVDNKRTFVSVKQWHPMPKFHHANMMAVSPYCEPPDWKWLYNMKEFYGRPIGYSDHSIGVDACIKAVKEFDCPVVEKHFTLRSDMEYNGHLFRDTVFGATATEFAFLAKEMRNNESAKDPLHNLQ